MNASLIQKAINRSNINLILISALGLLLVMGGVALSMRYLYNFVAGPATVQPADLIAASDPDNTQRYWVTVTGDDIIDTGAQYVSTSSSGKKTVDHSYYALALGKRLLLVKLDGNPDESTLKPTITGWMETITADENKEIIADLLADYPNLKGVFLPYKLNAGDFRMNGIIGLVVGLVVLALSLWGLFLAFRRASNPESHPILKSLARFGPLDFITSRIDAELSAPHTTLGNVHLTANWVVYTKGAQFLATRFDDMAWMYKHVLTTRSYGIAVGKTYTAMVYDRYGEQLKISAGRKEKDTDALLQALYQRAPWAVAGFANELSESWKKDRQNFLAQVERRKAQVASGGMDAEAARL